MQKSELVTVYTLNDPIKAEIIKNALQAEGIKCFLEGIHQADNVGLPVQEIKIQVSAESADRASHFIHLHETKKK
jgi:hypothetical protein